MEQKSCRLLLVNGTEEDYRLLHNLLAQIPSHKFELDWQSWEEEDQGDGGTGGPGDQGTRRCRGEWPFARGRGEWPFAPTGTRRPGDQGTPRHPVTPSGERSRTASPRQEVGERSRTAVPPSSRFRVSRIRCLDVSGFAANVRGE